MVRQHAVRIEGLSFGYTPERVFEGFEFACDQPIAVLAGRNGCGKTTLLKILSGVLAPDRFALFRAASTARLVLQEDALFPWLSVRENLALVRANTAPPTSPELAAPVEHILERHVFELSFGQRRLVELCRALENPPELLCLDEPFNFLDAGAREQVAFLIKAAAFNGRQIILSSHHSEDFDLFDAPVFRFPESRPITALVLDRRVSG